MIPTILARVTDPRLAAVARGHEIWTTLEGENPGGSVKDRMVAAELSRAMAAGELGPGDVVAEISAGSTALSLAAHARLRGLRSVVFVPSGLDRGLRARMAACGAEVHDVDPATAFAVYDDYCAKTGVWRLNQMTRPGLTTAYETWARDELKPVVGDVDWAVGAVGTGHSLSGVSVGLSPGRGACTAEPDTVRAVSGARNLKLERHGPDDPCDSSDFRRRLELGAAAFFPGDRVQTNLGEIAFPESFRVVLGAVETLSAEAGPGLRLFALGAGNRRA